MRIIDVEPISEMLRCACECGIRNDEGSHSVVAEAVLRKIGRAHELSADEFIIHGHWIKDITYDLKRIIRCSVCKQKNNELSNFCPNCGAKMDENGENNV